MYQKCCVPGCNSLRKYVLLHKFPKLEVIRRKWLECINSESLTNDTTNMYVCHKHFEKRFLKTSNRLIMVAYPTLFSDVELSSGKPSTVFEIPEVCSDHSYSRKRHFDHTYSLPDEETPKKIARAEVSDMSVLPTTQNDLSPDASSRFTPDSVSELQSVCDLSLYEEDVQALECEQPDPDTDATDVHECIVCNVCEKQIVGFRYVCVQCADWDHCAACEAGGAHAAHAVLRVHRQAQVQRVIDAVREAIRCACAELDVTLHMDVTHEDGFGQVTMDEDNKDDILLLELPSPVADGTERNPLELDVPFHTEDFVKDEYDTFTHNFYNEVTDDIHEENIQIIECPTAENAREVIHKPTHPVRVYSSHNNTKLSRVTQDIQHFRTTPIQHVGDVTKEDPISIQPFVSTYRNTKELIKQMSPEYIKKKTPVAPQESCKRILLQDKENIIAKGKLSQAEVDAAMKRQRLHQDTNSDDSS